MFNMNADCCGNCEFYMESAKVCRRNPPTVIIVGMKQSLVNPNMGDPQFASVFPQMTPNGWCGQHRRKEEIDA